MPAKILDSYFLTADNVKVEVEIAEIEAEFVRQYLLNLPEYGPGTQALLQNLKASIITDSAIKAERMLDPKFIKELKEKFTEKASKLLEKELPKASAEIRSTLIGLLLHEMLGLGKIEFLLNDGNLEEMVINSALEPVWVYHKKFGWLKTNIFITPDSEIQNFANIIARRVGKQITTLNPLLDAHLITGDRANATLFPISTRGNTITIRRFRRDPWTVTDFIDNKTASAEIMALVWLAIQYELNILISGGTGSGKTSMLNVFTPFIQANNRIISIEDSVSGTSEIVFEHDGKTTKTTVGGLIDNLIEDDSISDVSLENFEGIKILSSSKAGLIEWKEPSHFIRHKVKKDLLAITLKSGRQIEVTPNHSLFTLGNDAKISALNGSEIKDGSWLAVPRALGWKGGKVVFDLRKSMSAFEDCFVKSIEIAPLLKESRRELNYLFGKNNVCHAIKTGNASVEMILQLQKAPSAGFICSRLGTKIPFEIEVDEDLACFAGLWLADGCYDRNSVLMSVVEPEARKTIERIAERFGLKPKLHSDGITLMLNSKPLKQFFENVLELKGNAFTKRIPKWAFNLEKPLAAALLRGYFSGDGWVRKNDIAIRSSSSQLLKDTQTMLLRFGIPLRMKWRLLKDKTFEARISGAKFLKEYAKEVGFVIDKKTKASEKWLSSRNHDISDVIPLPKQFYKEIKKVLKSEVGKTISYKGWKSYGQCYAFSNMGRNTLQKIIQKHPELPAELHELAFNDIFWDCVEKIERKKFEGFVYDLSVPENENFICNNVLCHNTREISLPDFLHWVPLTTREPNAEGKGEISMLDLLVNSLRMRPDRIIVGEVRRQREAEVMFEAMHTGHSVYTTVHANTADETIRRLISPPVNIPVAMLDAVHLNLVMFRNRRIGARRVLQLAEYISEKRSEMEERVRANVLYRWKPATDEIAKHSESIRFYDELALHTGFTPDEMQKDLEKKRSVLEWMVKQKIRDITSVGRVIAEYYLDESKIMGLVEKSKRPEWFVEKEAVEE
ncbi:MAG TPA: Flp pilus assembly complex ATPase component TadA [Candidatus Diapherotrites archaeon]|uniref:Flp pilus assembly complex ATPase component TadA n=2 Tax=Candidatus Iainarchaeum sp. TaxID=3101447 RepID=A0A7J4JYB9_9ARCH|nr:Flp pilus assembly complex ATPase component TadA [Candidatus Diapherotrites archaeon]